MEESKKKRNREGDIHSKSIPPHKKSKEDATNNKAVDTSLRLNMPKGYKMMEIMGYKEGEILGKNRSALKEPIKVEIKPKKQGICTSKPDSSIASDMKMSKQKFIRWKSEKKHKERLEKIWYRIQKVAFDMMGDSELYNPGQDPRDFNVLWRSYVIQLNEELKGGNSNNDSSYNTDAKDGKSQISVEELESSTMPKIEKKEYTPVAINYNTSMVSDSTTDDTELAALEELSIEKRITKLNIFLRYERYYCFFCGIKYNDECDLYEHCPGVNEEDHE
ncbi:hypothetical protein SMKI_12G3290 [Saccharomyces mikatae IFO 1815]|uniref:G-patch domain-containing protein n=1 Tax=Saccharomyces mikatae IFO 1815 TaxID=226126 RepID=A0AA35IQS8_SACMI|nr:uncharacterized protein SMKI_12G3290 [Saccharomyces mikatae IFO 1815]CAI4035183.1 hypothetical protein SMKI_12G3290 [Saccharomyces mikatae IFO 1815]